jgi:CTP:molybdopterin cytidylyltransferase MocA
LQKLKGDKGGRALFSHYPVELMPWEDDRLLYDIDTPEDYRKLLENQQDE